MATEFRELVFRKVAFGLLCPAFATRTVQPLLTASPATRRSFTCALARGRSTEGHRFFWGTSAVNPDFFVISAAMSSAVIFAGSNVISAVPFG